MALRDWLSEHPRTTIGVVTTLVVLSTGYVVTQFLSTRRTIQTRLPDAYYTTDDGATFFAANSENVPPFEHEGKQAVRAFVFECPRDHTRFVGYVERYTPEAHKAMIEKRATIDTDIRGRELKKPGEKTWTKSGDNAAVGKLISSIRCPGGHDGTPDPVEP